MNKKRRKRFISNKQISREQSLWLCRAILTHYRSDGQKENGEHDLFNLKNRVHKTGRYKRGRDWSIHPVGYDLKEVWYGTEKSGVREAWAALVALPVSQVISAPDEHRTYMVYGLANARELSVAVYRRTEVVCSSADDAFLDYVGQCFSQLVDDSQEYPEYDPRGRSGRTLKENKPGAKGWKQKR